MNRDFKIMAQLLGAIRACEGDTFNMALVSEGQLRCSEKECDMLAVKLQKARYIEGLYIVDDIDNQPYPVILWEQSKPYITIAGITFIAENKPLREAIKELTKGALNALPAVVMNALLAMR